MDCTNHQECVHNALLKADLLCKDRKLRLTERRRAVLELIWQSHQPIKAYALLEKLNRMGQKTQAPTVYRILDFLVDNGLVHRLNSLDAYLGCSHPLRHQQCYFMLCNLCKCVVECCETELGAAIQETAARYNFTPHGASLEIQGLCQICRSAREEKG